MTPRGQRIAFQVWAYASPRGWDCTVNEIADEIGESWRSVLSICVHKGWTQRLRVQRWSSGPHSKDLRAIQDADLSRQGQRDVIRNLTGAA